MIAGHGRVLAAKLLGLTEVPAIRLQHLTEAQARAFMIADNRLTEKSAWDKRLLAEQFQALSALNLDFSIEVTGFELAEVDATIESLLPAGRNKDDPADLILNRATKTQVTRAGDCWVLNRHRIYCGDARIGSGYATLMRSQRAEMVLIDPPQIDAFDRDATELGEAHHQESVMSPHEMNAHESTNFLKSVLMSLASSSSDGAIHYVFIDWHQFGEMLGVAHSNYSEFKNLCVWVKEDAARGSLYRNQHELIFVFKHGRKTRRNNNRLRQSRSYRTDVWHYRRVNSISGGTDEGVFSALRQNIKPVELVADSILDCTGRGDIVLDPFLGSGTTIIAAERTGRVCYGIEVEPAYIDMMIRRWQDFAGQNAIQESTGRTFNELEEDAHEREQ